MIVFSQKFANIYIQIAKHTLKLENLLSFFQCCGAGAGGAENKF